MKKVLLIIGGSVLGLVVLAGAVFFLTPTILSAVNGKDDALLDDSALMPETVSIDKPGNAFDTLNSIDFGDENFSEMTGWFDMEGITDKIDLEKAKIIVSTHQKELKRYNQAAEMSYYQIPYLADPEQFDFLSDELLIPYNQMRSAGKIAALNTLILLQKGQTEAAIDQALNIYNVGYVMLNGNSYAISGLVGMSQSQLGLSLINRIKDQNQLNNNQTNYIHNFLSNRSDFSAGLKSIIKFEYLGIKNYIEVLNNGIASGEAMQLYKNTDEKDLSELAIGINKFGGKSYYFKPNQTLNDLIPILTEQLNHSSKPCEYQFEQVPMISPWKSMITENAIGKLYNNMQYEIYDTLYDRPCKLQTELNQIINS